MGKEKIGEGTNMSGRGGGEAEERAEEEGNTTPMRQLLG